MTCENAFENRALTVNRALPAPLSGVPLDATQFAKLMWEISNPAAFEAMREATYGRTLFRLQCELVKLQRWVHAKKLKIVVIFEGRDAAGKGGIIKRITHRLDPRQYRVVALGAPNERERAQWYFQRYIAHLPTGGEIVFFDRSWYNRAGVERVMGFCSDREYEEFLATVPHFENMITGSGIVLIKYWLSISLAEQRRRLMARLESPFKEWKLSPMDIESVRRWDSYTKAKEIMFQRTHRPQAPWWVVDAEDKRRARLNCMHHLLGQVPYRDVPTRRLALPEPQNIPLQDRTRPLSGFHVPLTY
jgi:polyphosphate kinase 2